MIQKYLKLALLITLSLLSRSIDANEFLNNTYWVSRINTTYSDANNDCKKNGGVLAVPLTRNHATFIINQTLIESNFSNDICFGIKIQVSRPYPISKVRRIAYKTSNGNEFEPTEFIQDFNLTNFDFSFSLELVRSWCLVLSKDDLFYFKDCYSPCFFICEKVESKCETCHYEDNDEDSSSLTFLWVYLGISYGLGCLFICCQLCNNEDGDFSWKISIPVFIFAPLVLSIGILVGVFYICSCLFNSNEDSGSSASYSSNWVSNSGSTTSNSWTSRKKYERKRYRKITKKFFRNGRLVGQSQQVYPL